MHFPTQSHGDTLLQSQKGMLCSLMLRTYAQTLKLGLKKAFFKDDPSATILLECE